MASKEPGSASSASPGENGRTNAPQPDSHAARYDDEISLIDLWRVLERRRWWLFGIALVVFLTGTAWALMQTPQYEFRTIISLPVDGDAEPLVPVTQLREEGEHLILPEVIQELREQHDIRNLSADLQRPGETAALAIRTTAPEARREAVERLHERLASGLLVAAGGQLETARAETESRLQAVQLEHDAWRMDLAARQDRLSRQVEEYQKQLEWLEDRQELVDTQRGEAVALLEELAAAPAGGAPDVLATGQASRVTLLARKQMLEREQVLGLPEQHQYLEQQLAAAQSALQRVTSELEFDQQRFALARADYERRLAQLRDAEVRGAVARMSDSPAEDPRNLVVALSLVLGLMLGVFGAFFREFLASVRATEE